MPGKNELDELHMVPCARCGETAQTLVGFLRLDEDPEKQTYRIICAMCGYQGDGTEKTVAEAAEAWNRFNTKKAGGEGNEA